MTSRQSKRYHFEFYSEPIRRASVGLTRGWVVDNLNCHGTTMLTLQLIIVVCALCNVHVLSAQLNAVASNAHSANVITMYIYSYTVKAIVQVQHVALF